MHFCLQEKLKLGPPVVPFYPFLGEGSPTKLDYRTKVGTLNPNLSTGGPSKCRNIQVCGGRVLSLDNIGCLESGRVIQVADAGVYIYIF